MPQPRTIGRRNGAWPKKNRRTALALLHPHPRPLSQEPRIQGDDGVHRRCAVAYVINGGTVAEPPIFFDVKPTRVAHHDWRGAHAAPHAGAPDVAVRTMVQHGCIFQVLCRACKHVQGVCRHGLAVGIRLPVRPFLGRGLGRGHWQKEALWIGRGRGVRACGWGRPRCGCARRGPWR